MNEHIQGLNRDQTLLFPDVLEKYVDEENPVRFIDAFVDTLNLEKMGFTHSTPTDTGRPSYDPKVLLKIYIYGYLNQVRSSRKLEKECHRNIEVIWLTKKLAPDHKTIADFRKDNVDCVKAVFHEFVKVCMRLDLYGAQFIAIDGVKFKAVNSPERNLNQKKLQGRLNAIDESVAKYINYMEAIDREEEKQGDKRAELQENVKMLLSKKEEYAEVLKSLKASSQNEVSFTDPDCRLMRSNRGKMEPGYNSHIAVDDKNHLIVDYNVTNNSSDFNELSPLAKSAKETLKVKSIEVATDKGFFTDLEIKRCVDEGVVPYVPEPKRHGPDLKKCGVPTPDFYIEKFVYDKLSDSYVCPAGNRMLFQCTVSRLGKVMRMYRSNACFSCRFFGTSCTSNRHGRIIERWEYEELLEDMRMRLRFHPEKMGARQAVVEHVFGTIKRPFNQGYFLLKGLEKVWGEVGFTMLAYNLRRALNILGSRVLVASLGRHGAGKFC